MRASCFVLAALVATGSFQYESLASACSPACGPPLILPASAQLPGNLAYFQVTTESSGQLALHTRQGEPVPASIRTIGGDRVYAPDATVPEGTELRLSYPPIVGCGFPEAAELNAFAFTAGAPAQVSLGAAVLRVVEQGATEPDASGYATAYAAVRFTSPNTNPATFALTRHWAAVDGEYYRGTLDSGEWQFTVTASCHPNAYAGGPDLCGVTVGYAPGLHELKIHTHVLGAETQPEPVTVQLDLRCPAAAEGESEEPFEGEGQDLLWEPRPTPGADGATGEDEGTDTAAVQDVVVGSGPSADAGSGCALASRNAASSLGWTAVGLLLGGGLLRRRRP